MRCSGSILTYEHNKLRGVCDWRVVGRWQTKGDGLEGGLRVQGHVKQGMSARGARMEREEDEGEVVPRQ
jgi:hypothetical protein